METAIIRKFMAYWLECWCEQECYRIFGKRGPEVWAKRQVVTNTIFGPMTYERSAHEFFCNIEPDEQEAIVKAAMEYCDKTEYTGNE